MKKYQQFKSSELDWIGDIPNNWQLVPLKKYLISIVDYRGKTPTKKEDGEIFLVTARNIKEGSINYSLSQEFISKDDYEQVMQRGKPIIGDVLFTTEAPLGEVANVDRDDIALAQRIIKFRANPRFLDNYYLKLWLSSYAFQSDLLRYATGSTALGIKASKLNFLRLLLPPIEEQRVILNYLDARIKKIKLLISNKQLLIELLKEERAAIINQAVTKGIDPDVEMKESGIYWLGKIPQQWKLIKLKWLTATTSGSTPNTSNNLYYDGNIPWVRTLDLNDGLVEDTEIKITNQALLDTNCKVLPTNSVLVAMYGGKGTIGKNGILKINAAVNQAVCAILPSDKFIPEFLHYFIKFYRPYWMIGAEGTRVDPNISQEHIKNMFFPVPPIEEQKRIVDYITSEISIIDNEKFKIQKEIALLQEYRTALISEVVTGKIDVREEVAAWT